MLNGDDLRRKPFAERWRCQSPAASSRVIQYVEHTEGDGDAMFEAVCKLGLEGIAKKLDAPYRSGPSKSWIKTKNPKAPAAIWVIEAASDRDAARMSEGLRQVLHYLDLHFPVSQMPPLM